MLACHLAISGPKECFPITLAKCSLSCHLQNTYKAVPIISIQVHSVQISHTRCNPSQIRHHLADQHASGRCRLLPAALQLVPPTSGLQSPSSANDTQRERRSYVYLCMFNKWYQRASARAYHKHRKSERVSHRPFAQDFWCTTGPNTRLSQRIRERVLHSDCRPERLLLWEHLAKRSERF